MSDAPTIYEIGTVLDFLKVPDHKMAECLREFFVWLAVARSVREKLGHLQITLPQSFDWIDDGLHIMQVTASTPDGERVLMSGTMKGFGDE